VADTVAASARCTCSSTTPGILYTANAVDTSDEQWLDTMAVNVNALFYLSRAAACATCSSTAAARSSMSPRNGS